MSNKQSYAMPYPGGNATIDRLHDGTTDIWIVNGAKGRKVLLLAVGTTEQQALENYTERFGNRYYDEDEEDAA